MLRTAFPIVMAATLLAGGCTRIRDSQGYLVDEQLVASVAPGVDTKDSVAKTLGKPSFAGQYGDDHWYYVSRATTQLAFLKPRPSGQNILVVTFDPAGRVTKVERRGLEKVVDISPNPDKTRTRGRETGLLEDLFSNIGQFGGVPGAGGAGGAGGGSGPH